MITEQLTFTQNKLVPFIVPERALTLAARFQAGATILKGQPLGLVTTAVSAVQTLTITGTPTGGTFRLAFLGFKTAAIAYNASAATVQAALEAIASIGTGNVTCTGGALPGTAVVITFAGAFAGSPQELITFSAADNLLTGGTNSTGAVTSTTTGAFAGGYKAWVGDLVAAPGVPTVAAASGGTGFGDGTNSLAYSVAVTFYNESGETTPSPAASVTVTSSNRTINVSAYNAVDANIQGARFYVNGSLAGTTAVSGGNIAATALTAFSAPGGTFPEVNGCYATRDGSHILRGLAMCDVYTDAGGRVTLGRVTTGMEQGQEFLDAPIYIEGFFSIGDLNGLTATNRTQLNRFGRFISGSPSDSAGVFRLGLL